MEIEKIGMNVRRHKELIIRMPEILEAHRSGQYIPAHDLIDLIADEPNRIACILDCIWQQIIVI
jgi:hypothetical protein